MCGDRAVFSKVLKEIVRIERPQATCQALGLCGDLGWPSTHSQITAFALITMLLRRKGAAPLSPGRTAAETAEIWLLTLLTATVAWSRVYLGYHDLQVTHCHVPNTGLLTLSVHALSLLYRIGCKEGDSRFANIALLKMRLIIVRGLAMALDIMNLQGHFTN